MSKIEVNRTSLSSDIKQEDDQYISYDAPPLDFSFKNIKSLAGKSNSIQNSKRLSLVREKRQLQSQKKVKQKAKNKKNKKNKEAKVMRNIKVIVRKTKSSN